MNTLHTRRQTLRIVPQSSHVHTKSGRNDGLAGRTENQAHEGPTTIAHHGNCGRDHSANGATPIRTRGSPPDVSAAANPQQTNFPSPK